MHKLAEPQSYLSMCLAFERSASRQILLLGASSRLVFCYPIQRVCCYIHTGATKNQILERSSSELSSLLETVVYEIPLAWGPAAVAVYAGEWKEGVDEELKYPPALPHVGQAPTLSSAAAMVILVPRSPYPRCGSECSVRFKASVLIFADANREDPAFTHLTDGLSFDCVEAEAWIDADVECYGKKEAKGVEAHVGVGLGRDHSEDTGGKEGRGTYVSEVAARYLASPIRLQLVFTDEVAFVVTLVVPRLSPTEARCVKARHRERTGLNDLEGMGKEMVHGGGKDVMQRAVEFWRSMP
ncbi:hypothetical protein R3P38DRAFT_3169740 [Favolaschia claudopus]|uniref:Uncharacterized protein n=1 Tax=Favolaschia claudopus TaxID=2862362 RepID=A0AAW0E2A6_9AGAR